MANPQLENGYIRIANELYQELYKADLTSSELRIMLFIIYQTYGFNKKMRKMSASYISQYAEIPVQTVRRAISSLINKNFLISKSNGHNIPKSYGIQKDYDKWVLKNEQLTTQRRVLKNEYTPTQRRVLKNERLTTHERVPDYSKMSETILTDEYQLKTINKRHNNKDIYIQDSSSCRTTTDRTTDKPSLEEIKSYVNAMGYSFNPEKFFRHYEITGWKYKGNPIENWKLLADRWNETEKKSTVNESKASYDIEELEKIAPLKFEL